MNPKYTGLSPQGFIEIATVSSVTVRTTLTFFSVRSMFQPSKLKTLPHPLVLPNKTQLSEILEKHILKSKKLAVHPFPSHGKTHIFPVPGRQAASLKSVCDISIYLFISSNFDASIELSVNLPQQPNPQTCHMPSLKCLLCGYSDMQLANLTQRQIASCHMFLHFSSDKISVLGLQ